MLNLVSARLKSAETALAAGRWDEAFRLAAAPDIAAHRRGRRVLEQACEALFQRGEAHFKAGRLAEALHDLHKAEAGGVRIERVQDLKAIVQAAIEEQQRQQHERRQRLNAAQQRLAEGSLRAAEQILAGASEHDQEAAAMRDKARVLEDRAGQLLEDVARHVRGENWPAAVQRFKQARGIHPRDPQVLDWENALVQHLAAAIQGSLRHGMIVRAFEESRLLDGIGDDRPAKQEVMAVLSCLSAAGAALRGGDFEAARRSALQLQHLLPDARWVGPVCAQLQQIDELTTALHGGPLGLVPAVDPIAVRPQPGPAAVAGSPDPSLEETRVAPAGGLPERLLVLIDGAGSFLLLRQPRTFLGRAMARQPADIPIFADISERHAEIARVNEDYFLHARRQVNVAGHNVVEKLLQPGDRIVLGKRAKLTFKVPSRKSSTAVLELGDAVKIPHAVRRVVLFDRLATIGRSSNAHMVVPTAGEDLVLFERGGALYIRPQNAGRHDLGQPVMVGQPFEMLGVSMVIRNWT